jgi:hypothetical protein
MLSMVARRLSSDSPRTAAAAPADAIVPHPRPSPQIGLWGEPFTAGSGAVNLHARSEGPSRSAILPNDSKTPYLDMIRGQAGETAFVRGLIGGFDMPGEKTGVEQRAGQAIVGQPASDFR